MSQMSCNTSSSIIGVVEGLKAASEEDFIGGLRSCQANPPKNSLSLSLSLSLSSAVQSLYGVHNRTLGRKIAFYYYSMHSPGHF